jgi:hypothetical protein
MGLWTLGAIQVFSGESDAGAQSATRGTTRHPRPLCSFVQPHRCLWPFGRWAL